MLGCAYQTSVAEKYVFEYIFKGLCLGHKLCVVLFNFSGML